MKVNSILASFALSALQVHASPVEVGSAGLEQRDGGFCCVQFSAANEHQQFYLQRGIGDLPFVVKLNGVNTGLTCPGTVWRPYDNNCVGWKFRLDSGCSAVGGAVSISVAPPGAC
ncbi:hypothetical protein E4U42_003735 [Claviceps africana]|uniref:Uncharacterized protein n=1 Tax=Claviceps africana TaxID=83212 RepID=A0A8K0J6R7_9HYPO|nr:hypothetical protein E4U42_003735 [Claviceps africana]